MKQLLLSLLLIMAACIYTSAQTDTTRTFTMKEGEVTYTMKRYIFCFYLKGPNRSSDKKLAEELGNGHMAHINYMDKQGVLCMAGPFGDDGEKRGILLFDLGTVEEAEKYVKEDPMVKAGWLTYELHPWWGAVGSALK